MTLVRRTIPIMFLLTSFLFSKEAFNVYLPSPPATQRQLVQAAMKQRPQDPWPRGVGHVILAYPGSRQDSKAYHEPGGNFSPGVSSFGVSFWMLNPQRGIWKTSDNLPLSQIRQQFVWMPAESSPGNPDGNTLL